MQLPQPSLLPGRERWVILIYLGGVTMLAAVIDPSNAMLDVPLSFVMKNGLRLDASDISTFRLISGAPLYLSFLFGLVRDNWSPFALGDRGYILSFGVLSVIVFGALYLAPISSVGLISGYMLLTCASLFIASAQNGLGSTIGRQHAMTGQMSTVWNLCTAGSTVVAYLVGGSLSQALATASPDVAIRTLSLIGATASLLLCCLAIPGAPGVYSSAKREHGPPSPFMDLRRIVRHRPIYPALTIWFLWNFSPSSITPLQYRLQNVFGAADWDWGAWNATYTVSFVPTFAVFGILCRHIPLKRLLWWGTVVAIPQFLPVLWAETLNQMFLAAVAAGLMGGIATAAFVDLLIRSGPPGLQGTMLMAASAVFFASTRLGDLVGSHVYERVGGFTACVALSTLASVFILAVLQKVPCELTRYSDGAQPRSSP